MADTVIGPLSMLNRIPGMRQLLMLIGLAVSITVGITTAFWANEPAYSLLYSNISGQDAAEIIDILTAGDIPYELDRKSGAILVAEDRIHDARLKLASQGLPRGSGFGMEILAGDSGFTTSQFMEKARYQHALETELAKTISNLRPVQSARVHLALPKNTVFLRKRKKSTASVLVYLYPGRTIEKPQVAAIVNLVASSVPELEAGEVTVVDQHGRLLKSPGDDTAMTLSTGQFEYVQRLEATYVERILSILAPILGPERVRATVTASIDFTQLEETREQFDPANSAVRSEQLVQNRNEGGTLIAAGIPGALSNQPPTEAVAEAAEKQAAGPTSSSSQSTRNYEIDRTLSHTQHAATAIDRLSIAVILDHKPVTNEEGEASTEPLTEAELTQVRQLVEDAVGFEPGRGDRLSISNIAFFAAPEPPQIEAPGFLERPGMRDLIKSVVGGLVLLFIGFRISRPIVTSLSKGLTMSTPRSAAPEANVGPLSYDDKISIARQLADKNPERVALVVRQWVAEDG